MVTSLFDCREMLASEAVLQAVGQEAEGLVHGDTWRLDAVRELQELKRASQSASGKVISGQLMTLHS